MCYANIIVKYVKCDTFVGVIQFLNDVNKTNEKILESITNTDEFYKEVTEDEFDGLCDKGDDGEYYANLVQFDDVYYEKISELLKERYTIELYFIGHLVRYTRIEYVCDIIQCNDEWFCVDLSKEEKLFICDQFEGLLKLLKDKEIIN
jgi:hypothetical protein